MMNKNNNNNEQYHHHVAPILRPAVLGSTLPTRRKAVVANLDRSQLRMIVTLYAFARCGILRCCLVSLFVVFELWFGSRQASGLGSVPSLGDCGMTGRSSTKVDTQAGPVY